MNCLCCGKVLASDSVSGWHKACVKRFFGAPQMPEIDINDKTMEFLATESTNRGYSVAGAQKKLSLHLYPAAGKVRLTVVDYPTGYILKPQVKEFESLPEAEHLVMHMAAAGGITTVPNALVRNGDTLAYITKRVDRVFTRQRIQMLAMEDFCQLDLRLTQDKYKGSYERCARIIDKYSSRKGFDMTELFMRLVFSYIVGNSDMHLKNSSLLETGEGTGDYVLSPAYDLLPVNVIMPEDKEQFALAINGKKNNIRKNDFLVFADACNIPRISAEKMIGKLVSTQAIFISMCEQSLLPEKMKDRLATLIRERISAL